MAQYVKEVFLPIVISATANVSNVRGSMVGIFVSSASASPTITVYDSATTTTTNPVVATFTPIAGTFYAMPFNLFYGCYVVISGTVSCTVGVSPI